MAGIDLGDAWADNVWEENTWANGVWAGQESYPQGGGGGGADPEIFDVSLLRFGSAFIRKSVDFVTQGARRVVRGY